MSSISVAEYKRIKTKPSKYRSHKVKYEENGVEKTKDSKKEYRRSLYLKQLEKEGKISKLLEQQVFVLQDRIMDGKKVLERAIKFIPDFVYMENGEVIVEDVKSSITKKKESYIIKRKLFRKLFPQFQFREF